MKVIMKKAAIAAQKSCLKNSITYSTKVSGFFLSFFFQNKNFFDFVTESFCSVLSFISEPGENF
jgi:hypothetical protein